MDSTPRTQMPYPTRYEIIRRDYLEGRIEIEDFEQYLEILFHLRIVNERCPYQLPSSQRSWAYQLR